MIMARRTQNKIMDHFFFIMLSLPCEIEKRHRPPVNSIWANGMQYASNKRGRCLGSEEGRSHKMVGKSHTNKKTLVSMKEWKT